MPATAILFGRLLILLGIIGYAYGLYSGAASFTALIPAIFGLILMVLGHIASSKENLRKHIMHAAVVVGLLGFLLPAGRILSTLGNFKFSFAAAMLILMAVLCGAFVALCVKSFIDARRSGAV
ncbi:MAG TPA: hypothetical protein PKE66_15145 [Pyrinomonadaceae bacterium]|nr:hypothetical protein [Pyrinomonadaceae bacterium]